MSVDTKASNEANATANADASMDGADTTTAASEVNARLLEESKKNKKALQETRSQLDALTKAKLEEQGKEKERADYWQKKHDELYKNLVKSTVKSAVTVAAQKAGAVDTDAVYALGNKELLQFDESTLEVSNVDQMIEDLKKSKTYLFTPQKSPNINGATPGGVVKGSSKTLKELSKDEIMSQLRALKN